MTVPEGLLTGDLPDMGDLLSVGHKPAGGLSPQDESLFRAFQSNLLSLISHELRTPLTGILNSLSLLESGEIAAEFSAEELIAMARRNAQRLHRTLGSLLDLAALESGTFHARLKEVDFPRLVRGRVESHQSLIKDNGLQLKVEGGGRSGGAHADLSQAPLLADPQKLGRAIDLCLDILLPRAEASRPVTVKISPSTLVVEFFLKPGLEELWKSSWTTAQAGFEGGIAAPGSAFAGTMQSEEAFLTRMEEGLGSEFLLIMEIMKLHQGAFDVKSVSSGVPQAIELHLELPEMSSEDGLKAVLASRTYQASMELGSVALGLVQVPDGMKIENFRSAVQKSLFRASDAVYALPGRNQIALVMDDCKAEDAPRLLSRIEKGVGVTLRYGVAACPSEGFDPVHLIELAERRLGQPRSTRS